VLDLVTGCFEGGVYVLDGLGEGRFAEARPILDKEGAWLRLGAYWDQEANEWTEVKTSHFASEHGASAFAVDWDDDGDLDLLLGARSGAMFLRFNEGTATDPQFAPHSVQVQAAGTNLHVPGGGAMVEVADWDQDGLWDVVAGGDEGVVVWFRNVGELGAPELADAAVLVEALERGARTVTGEPTRPGERLQVDVGDWDGDGLLDLLVGDYQMVAAESRVLTDAEGKELDALRAERELLMERLTALRESWDGEGDWQDGPDGQRIMGRYRELAARLGELEQRPTRHGWVWLYRRLPAEPGS